MGDGGLGIGGAHVLSTCRRNVDVTLLVLNNFNYGMTGGQCSSTTPPEAVVGSGFLNRLEKPVDIGRVAAAAGAPMVRRISTYDAKLPETLQGAIAFEGFALVDIWGICPGRYTRRNKLSPRAIEARLENLPPLEALTAENAREEYGAAYRREASRLPAPAAPPVVEARCQPVAPGRQEVVLLGSAGQRIVTAGELFCLAGAAAGLHATQKNDYPITVMRGHSVSELILSREAVDYTGIEAPTTVVALAAEGVARRRALLERLDPGCTIVAAAGVALPDTRAKVVVIDFKAHKIKSPDWAVAALAYLARAGQGLTLEMLQAALALRFKGPVLEQVQAVVQQMVAE
jgi:Pyruvate/2-oxoacid:ferredoxin oxidoreductase gamma subunit